MGLELVSRASEMQERRKQVTVVLATELQDSEGLVREPPGRL